MVATVCLSIIFVSKTRAQQPRSGDGYALLDSSDVIFKILSPDTGYLQKVNQIVEKLMGEVGQAREKNMVDKVFFVRYHRLFGIIKIGIEPDREKILSPLISRFLVDFVLETLGEDYRVSSPETVPLLAMAVRGEIINLRLHLDNTVFKPRFLPGYYLMAEKKI